MKNVFYLLLVFMLSGCIVPHKISYEPASIYFFNDQICIYVSEYNLQLEEKILSISVREYGIEKTLLSKNYANLSENHVLISGKCIKDFSSLSYEIGKGYVAEIRTPLNLYISKFVVWKRIDGMATMPM